MKTTLTTLFIALLVLPLAGNGQSQNGWRGPSRSGIYNETGLMKSWAAGGPSLAWENLALGKGYSSPTIVGERVYITGTNEENKEVFYALNLSDGKTIWSTVYGNTWKDNYPESRTTPTILNDKAYVISGAGEVVCLNIADGRIVWSVDGGTKFERKPGIWGTSESPLIVEGKVIYTPCGDKTTMVALDAANGNTVWQSESLNQRSGYVAPLLINHNGKKQIITSTSDFLMAIDPNNGAIIWKTMMMEQSKRKEDDGSPVRTIFTNTPIYEKGKIVVTNGYDQGTMLVELSADGNSVKEVWRNYDMDVHIGGAVLVDGVVYGTSWINNNQGNWVALDFATGKTLYNTPWTGKIKGAIIYADGMLYCYEERRGTVALVKTTTEKFDVVSEFRITKGEGPHWAHPVISNDKLFIRHGSALMAFKIK